MKEPIFYLIVSTRNFMFNYYKMIKEDKIYRFVIEILHQLGNNLCICFRFKVKSFGFLLKR